MSAKPTTAVDANVRWRTSRRVATLVWGVLSEGDETWGKPIELLSLPEYGVLAIFCISNYTWSHSYGAWVFCDWLADVHFCGYASACLFCGLSLRFVASLQILKSVYSIPL